VAALCPRLGLAWACLLLLAPACGAPPPDETEPPPPASAALFDVAAFESVMAGPDAKARTVALDELLAATEPPAAMIPAVARALADENRWVRDRAARALTRFGPRAAVAVPDLVRALRDPDGFVRWRSAKALAAMGPAAAPAVDELERMASASDETELGRHWSARALVKIREE